MNSIFHKKTLLFAIPFVVLLIACVFQYSKADASGPVNSFSDFNLPTQAFVDRLNMIPEDFFFEQSLSRGDDVDPDVMYLKWILNSDVRTQLTDDPRMDFGDLTSIFGPLTENAVRRFQTLYSRDILAPLGLTNPTGTVGDATMQELNMLLYASRNFNDGPGDNDLDMDLISGATASSTYVDFSGILGNNSSSTPSDNSTSTATTTINSTSTPTYDDLIISTSTSSLLSALSVITGSSSTTTSTTSNSTTASSNSNTSNSSNNNTNNNSNHNYSSNSSGSNGSGSTAAIGGAIAGGLMGGGSSSGGSGSSGNSSGASSNSVQSHFGGNVTDYHYCTCVYGAHNTVITIMDKMTNSSLTVSFQPGVSMLKMNYTPTQGQTVLGGYNKVSASCMDQSGYYCTNYAHQPTGIIDMIRGIGSTSSGGGM